VGDTPGQALDAIAAVLPQADAGTLVVVQQFRPEVSSALASGNALKR
jgi:hypothetical protein